MVALEPLDPEAAVDKGWPETVADIEERVVSWYESEGVAEASEGDLERAVTELTDAISNPPVERDPEAVMYITEMNYRREAACRSLPSTNRLRSEYCSAKSVPDLDDEAVPWAP